MCKHPGKKTSGTCKMKYCRCKCKICKKGRKTRKMRGGWGGATPPPAMQNTLRGGFMPSLVDPSAVSSDKVVLQY